MAEHDVRPEGWRKLLLLCGIASSVLYALMIWAIRYEGYNPLSQVPSELTAIGAPTQALWARLAWVYTLLMAAFGFGIWKSAGRNRVARIAGGLFWHTHRSAFCGHLPRCTNAKSWRPAEARRATRCTSFLAA